MNETENQTKTANALPAIDHPDFSPNTPAATITKETLALVRTYDAVYFGGKWKIVEVGHDNTWRLAGDTEGVTSVHTSNLIGTVFKTRTRQPPVLYQGDTFSRYNSNFGGVTTYTVTNVVSPTSVSTSCEYGQYTGSDFWWRAWMRDFRLAPMSPTDSIDTLYCRAVKLVMTKYSDTPSLVMRLTYLGHQTEEYYTNGRFPDWRNTELQPTYGIEQLRADVAYLTKQRAQRSADPAQLSNLLRLGGCVSMLITGIEGHIYARPSPVEAPVLLNDNDW